MWCVGSLWNTYIAGVHLKRRTVTSTGDGIFVTLLKETFNDNQSVFFV